MMMSKYFKNGFLLFGAITMLVMSNHYFFSTQTGILGTKALRSADWYVITFRSHIFFGIIALFIGLFQVITAARKAKFKQHKIIGYAYVITIGISSIAGFIIAQFAMGGILTRLGFSVLALVWAFTTYRGTIAAINGNFEAHRTWMLRSYAVTFSAVTQRTMLLIPLLTSIEFMPIYQLSAWLPWIINIIIVEQFSRRKKVQMAV